MDDVKETEKRNQRLYEQDLNIDRVYMWVFILLDDSLTKLNKNGWVCSYFFLFSA